MIDDILGRYKYATLTYVLGSNIIDVTLTDQDGESEYLGCIEYSCDNWLFYGYFENYQLFDLIRKERLVGFDYVKYKGIKKESND